MLGWAQVERNAGAAGVDRMSVKKFAQARDCYLAELARALRDGRKNQIEGALAVGDAIKLVGNL